MFRENWQSVTTGEVAALAGLREKHYRQDYRDSTMGFTNYIIHSQAIATHC